MRNKRSKILRALFAGAFLLTGSLYAAPATVSTITGGDPGEGLDLQGNFTYAINIGPSGPAGKAGDANFTGDNVPGVTVTANNQIATGGWGAVNYGPSDADNVISLVMNSIRWADGNSAQPVVTVTLAVEKGVEYKLQILEHEDCCPGRGFNIVMDGVTEVTNFKPGPLQQGDTYPPNPDFVSDPQLHLDTKNVVGVVVTKQFVAANDTVTIVFDGPSADDPAITDHNAIVNGLTLERITASSDSDGDGLPDDWEKKYFGNLDQKGTDDPDKDGLTNAEEVAASTDPTNADSDGDGVLDGDEVKTYKSNPLKTDTDGDSLADGYEVKISKSDPTKVDTDGDGSTDLEEFIVGTDPNNKDIKPTLTSVGVIKGGDPGEGLDLKGNFIYALAVGADPGTAVQVGDALFQGFTLDEVAGATITAVNGAVNWYQVVYGDTPADLDLATATSSIRYQGPVVTLVLDNLKVGAEYKVQLMFGEQCCNRGFGIFFDDVLVAKEFNPGIIQGGINDKTKEALLTHTFFAKSTSVTIKLDVRAASFPDPNPILNAATVEEVAGPADTDGDGLPDAWELLYFGDLSKGATDDPDGDGLKNSEEYTFGSNPNKADADGDGLNDAQEKAAGTNPNLVDSDGDGLKDNEELSTYHTNPTKADTDGDGLTDSAEILTYHTDPTKADTDSDGVSDGLEILNGTDPLVSNRPSMTAVSTFNGAAPDQGLDLTGNFIYALAVGGPPEAAVQIHDAAFLPILDTDVPGATLEAGNTIPGWYKVVYGDSVDDQNLALATSSIRWSDYNSGTIPYVLLTLENLEVGAEYKIQMMFGEECCNRSYDLFIDDQLKLKNFNPGKIHGGIANHSKEALITQLYIAKDTKVVIRLDGRLSSSASGSDHNAILNAVTVEKLAGPADTDADGLPDEWEKFWFGNLSQTATGDPDGDGLTNAQEYQLGSDPGLAELTRDSDGDGLADIDEVLTYHTDPTKADTDGDGLNDGAEVKTYHTDPTKADSDADGVTDDVEVATGGDPAVKEPATTFANMNVGAFTGGDDGEGLDLQGNFLYAFNVSSAGAAGKAGDADFTADSAPGITVTAPNNVPAWDLPEYGDTANDDVIEKVTQSIRYGPEVRVRLDNLVPGSTYKVQLLFYEQCCDTRGFNVYADGVLIAENFSPPLVQGGVNNTSSGAVVSAEFTTQRDHVIIVCTTYGRSDPSLTDPNAILDGVTLEILKGGVPTSFKITSTTKDAAGFKVGFESVVDATYVLEYKQKLTDATWQNAGQIKATGTSSSLTDSTAAHLSAASGFWRVTKQ